MEERHDSLSRQTPPLPNSNEVSEVLFSNGLSERLGHEPFDVALEQGLVDPDRVRAATEAVREIVHRYGSSLNYNIPDDFSAIC